MNDGSKTGYSNDIMKILAAVKTPVENNSAKHNSNNDINEILEFANNPTNDVIIDIDQRPTTPGFNQIQDPQPSNNIIQKIPQSKSDGSQKFLEIATDEALVFKCLAKLLLKNFTNGTF